MWGRKSRIKLAKTAATAKRLHTHRLPYISVLTNPTSGEVYASFANLGDMILAEPQALLGFAPLRVVEQASGKHLSESSHTAEDHLKHGMIDQIVDRTRLRQVLSILLDLLSSPYRLTLTKKGKPYPMPDHVEEPAWQTVQLARHQMRPTALDYIVRITTSFIELHGDRHFGDDKAVVCGIAEFSGIAAIIIGQERSHNEGRCYPEGLRKAQRAMRMAAIFGLPVITLIDTPGAHPGIDAEERGIGQAIASTLALMSDLPTPMISVIIGEGGSEGALALGVTDRILMLEHAIYSAISPEQAAGIIYRDARKAEEMASALKLTALDCKDLGVIDIVVPEPEVGAHTDHDEAARLLKNVLLRQLLELQQVPRSKLVKERYKKYRRIGEYSSYFRAAFSKDISDMQDLLQRSVSRLRHHLPAGDRAKNTTEGD